MNNMMQTAPPLDQDEITDLKEMNALRGEIERLKQALIQVSRMKLFSDDKTNRFTLTAAIMIAEKALADE